MLRLSPGDASASSVNPHYVWYVMVTAIRVPFWSRALAVIVPVAPWKAPVPPVTVPWVTGPSDSLITPYRKPPLRSTATPIAAAGTAVRAAAAGQAVFGSALAQRLRAWFASGPRPSAEPFPQLTRREREILDGVAAGLTNAQIGQQMFLSAKTVANNVSNILAKLQLAERAQAIVAARDAGLGRQAGRQGDGTAERS